MAKTGDEERPRGRKPKKTSARKSPDEMLALAEELKEVAEEIKTYATNAKLLELGDIRPLTGNYQNALQKIREFAATQVIAKYTPLMARRNMPIKYLFRAISDTKNS